ncbi:hypothetical protein NXW06_21655 [Bacteroides fragilis]|nr:hypothetical protein NXW06_21655 [Bacteroides fragilis]
MNKFKVTTEVRAILQDSLGIKTMVGDKIFPLVAPNGTEGGFYYISTGWIQAGVHQDGSCPSGSDHIRNCRE